MNERTPTITELSCYLSNTAALATLLIEKCFVGNPECVACGEVLDALSANGFHGEKAGPAHDFMVNYSALTGSIKALQDRIDEALRLCESIEVAEQKAWLKEYRKGGKRND